MPRASNAQAKNGRSRCSPVDITDIMRPTAGVIEFTRADHASLPQLAMHSLDTTICLTSPASSSFPSPSTPSDSDDAWNLIPYHVSWGHEYHAYRPGKLPGPEGDCIFLRSPTPLKNQRTTEACKKCRERKAKCSGDRPSCARCSARGFACEYASGEQEESSVSKARKRKREASIASSTSTSSSSLPPPTPLSATAPSLDMFVAQHQRLDTSVKYEEMPNTLAFDCESPGHGSYWEPSALGEQWPVSYVPSFGGEGFHADGMYNMSACYDDRVLPPTPSILAPQPIRRSSIVQLEADSRSSFSSATTDISGAFTSGTLTPASSDQFSTASGDDQWDVAQTMYIDNRLSHYEYVHPAPDASYSLQFDGSWPMHSQPHPYSDEFIPTAPHLTPACVPFA